MKVQQEAECKLHNSEAAKTSLEVKIKTQEKELRAEVGEATSEAARLGKQLEEVGNKKNKKSWNVFFCQLQVEKRLEQEGKAARQKTDCLTAQMEKAEASRR